MNKILLMNGVLLLSLLGFLQWIECHHVAVIESFQWSVYRFCPWSYQATFYFLIASFVMPLIATIAAKRWRISRLQINSLLVINPVLFFMLAFMSTPPLGHEWTAREILGPSIIVGFNESKPEAPGLLVSASGFCQQCIVAAQSNQK